MALTDANGLEESRAKRPKESISDIHERLDHLIMEPAQLTRAAGYLNIALVGLETAAMQRRAGEHGHAAPSGAR